MGVGRIGADQDDRRRYVRPSRSPACRPTFQMSCSSRSRSASGRRGRRCSRHCRRWRRAAPRIFRRHPGKLRHFFRTVARFGDERRPIAELVPIAALAHEFLVDQTFGHDDVRQCREDRDIRARQQRQMIGRFDVRRPHQIDAARIDYDQLGALPAAASSSVTRTPDARRSDWRRSRSSRRYVRPNRSPACRPTFQMSCSSRSRSASGRRGRRCRHCCCRRWRAPVSAPGRFPRRCSATR